MKAVECFPFDSFREYQEEVINKIQGYFEEGIEVVVFEGPTGFGKSPVNLALGKYFAPSYYTTPQKSLREQLGNSFGGSSEVVVLKARKDYACKASGVDSNRCRYRDFEPKCSKNPECTYWIQKRALFDSNVGILTFSNLIVNTYLPIYSENGKQISFKERDLLIVDECHGLEGQVASLHAGFNITPNSFPNIDIGILNLRNLMWDEIKEDVPKSKKSFLEIKELIPFLEKTLSMINEYESSSRYGPYFTPSKVKLKMTNLKNKIRFLFKELEVNRAWIVNLDYLKSWNQTVPHFKPIRIDNFLKQHIWWYGNKILLTSATILYRNNIKGWLERIGLKDKSFKFLSVPMNFPIENRPIYLNKIGGSLSFKNKQRNWNGCINNVKEILRENKGKQGVIHVSSYSMMWDLFKKLKREFSIFLHNKNQLDGVDVIEAWIESSKEILISPSIFEGVDLKDELCRFQILFKVPYANLKDGRVNHLLYKNRDSEWYNNETMMKIAQAYGRAVRSKEDHAKFYIIDGDFLPFYSRVIFPNWFKEAIVR